MDTICYICWHNGEGNVQAIAVCNELNKPVCAKHADVCRWDDGHGCRPLGTDRPVVVRKCSDCGGDLDHDLCPARDEAYG